MENINNLDETNFKIWLRDIGYDLSLPYYQLMDRLHKVWFLHFWASDIQSYLSRSKTLANIPEIRDYVALLPIQQQRQQQIAQMATELKMFQI